MGNIWGILIGQFFLPMYVPFFFFHSEEKSEKEKRNVSEETHILQHRVSRKLSLSFCKD